MLFSQYIQFNFNLSLFLSLSQKFWSPTSSIQNTIILLIEKIVVAMGDELKAYIPRMVQPVLKLFLQDQSPMRVATQKVRLSLPLDGSG